MFVLQIRGEWSTKTKVETSGEKCICLSNYDFMKEDIIQEGVKKRLIENPRIKFKEREENHRTLTVICSIENIRDKKKTMVCESELDTMVNSIIGFIYNNVIRDVESDIVYTPVKVLKLDNHEAFQEESILFIVHF